VFRSPNGAIGKASQSTAGITATAELEAVEVGAAVTSQPGKETYQLRWWVMGGLGPLALRIFLGSLTQGLLAFTVGTIGHTNITGKC
jgi:hypothetical protein